ncbi:SRPBCC domain-containing protein [Rhodocytophaga rosea]|uniref:SRPBCC domain-containing protein n=1 Tax=Rhodocytophaga rosea TaxID=2704465 RepID=UPI00374323F6
MLRVLLVHYKQPKHNTTVGQTTKTSKIIHATAETIYKALTSPAALEVWQAPGDMTAKVHNFDFRVGGGYQMSLFYSDNERKNRRKRGQIYGTVY